MNMEANDKTKFVTQITTDLKSKLLLQNTSPPDASFNITVTATTNTDHNHANLILSPKHHHRSQTRPNLGQTADIIRTLPEHDKKEEEPYEAYEHDKQDTNRWLVSCEYSFDQLQNMI